MTIVIIGEHYGQTALELTAKARSIAPDACLIALCEEGNTAGFAAAGANEQIVIPFVEDDCAQAERIADALRQLQAGCGAVSGNRARQIYVRMGRGQA